MLRVQTFDSDVSRTGLRGVSPDRRYIYERMFAWGAWARVHDFGVGWQKLTILGRLIEQGANGAGQKGAPPSTFIPEPIAEVEAAVGKLNAVRRVVICVRFVYSGENDSREMLARKAGMTDRKWKDELGAALDELNRLLSETVAMSF